MFLTPSSPARPAPSSGGSPDQPQRTLDSRGPTDRLPVAVRDRQARDAFRYALRGFCVDIVGPRLSGRSSVLEQLERHCQGAGVVPLLVHGVADALPYDSLRAALATRAGGQQANPVPASALVQRLGDLDPSLIIVDDADMLDAGSWSALRLAHRSFGTPVILTTGSGGPLTGRSVSGFARSHARIVLEPLDAEDVHDVLVAYLGGQVSPSLVSRVLVKSGGLAGVASAIARSALAGGSIRQGDGSWYDAPGLWDDGLAVVYDALVADLPAEELGALEILASVGAIDVPSADQLVGRDLLERLEDLDRVRLFTPHGSPLVAVNPPGLADYFAHRPSSVRRMRVLDTIARHAGGGQEPVGSEPLGTIRSVGVVASDDQLPFVARMFAESGRAQARIALARWTSSPTVASALLVLTLGLSQSSDRSALRPILVGTGLTGCAPRDELTFRYLRARWSMQASHEIADIEAAFVGDVSTGFEFREALAALQSAFRMERTGITTADIEELGARVGGPDADGELARIALGFALIHSARPDEAIEALTGDFSPTSALVAAHLAVAKGLALCASGRYQEASEWATKHIDDAVSQGERIALASHAYVAVLAESGLGRLERAYSIAKLVFSLDVSSSCLLFDTDKALLNLAAVIALRTGRESAAESFAAHARTLASGSDAVPFNADAFYEAAKQLHRGSPKNAAATQKALAGALRARGYRFAADFATMLSLSADFDPELAAEFRERGRELGGDRYIAYLDGQLALQRGDADEILTIGRRLRDLGARDEALLLLTHARRILRGADRSAEAEAARVEISALLEAGTPAESTLGHSRLELTTREQELVRLVGAGLSNAEIASQLHISVRTVDTHLRNIRKKAGASSREDLGLLASTC